jgi:AcrR family transcriptional regulator
MDEPAVRDRRSEILDAAEAVVMRDGARALTLDAVAAQARISKGGVLYHFRTKEDLAAAMIERAIAWFDRAVADAAAADSEARGRFLRAYLRASFGAAPLAGRSLDVFTASITTALLAFPERLAPIRAQGDRAQAAVQADGLDPVLATIVRLAIDGLWLSENFNLMRFDPALKAQVMERLIAWTRGNS